MQDVFKIHEVARIRTGRYAGLVGTVTGHRQDAATGKQTGVQVKVEGVREGEAITAQVWLKRSQVERNHG